MNNTPPPTSARSKTLSEWREKIVMSLGGFAWNEELSEKDIDHAIACALSLFNKYHPEWRWKPLGHLTQDLRLDCSMEEQGTRVVDVKFQNHHNHFYRPFHHPLPDQYWGIREPRRVFQRLQADDRYSSFLGIQPTWHWDEKTRTLFITNCANVGGVLATALFLTPMTIENIPFSLEIDFLECAVGYAKRPLGRKLRKFGAIPTAGGDVSLDGNELQNEGEKAIEEIEKKLDKNLRHMPPKPIF
jgi:hypothetical protein